MDVEFSVPNDFGYYMVVRIPWVMTIRGGQKMCFFDMLSRNDKLSKDMDSLYKNPAMNMHNLFQWVSDLPIKLFEPVHVITLTRITINTLMDLCPDEIQYVLQGDIDKTQLPKIVILFWGVQKNIAIQFMEHFQQLFITKLYACLKHDVSNNFIESEKFNFNLLDTLQGNIELIVQIPKCKYNDKYYFVNVCAVNFWCKMMKHKTYMHLFDSENGFWLRKAKSITCDWSRVTDKTEIVCCAERCIPVSRVPDGPFTYIGYCVKCNCVDFLIKDINMFMKDAGYCANTAIKGGIFAHSKHQREHYDKYRYTVDRDTIISIDIMSYYKKCEKHVLKIAAVHDVVIKMVDKCEIVNYNVFPFMVKSMCDIFNIDLDEIVDKENLNEYKLVLYNDLKTLIENSKMKIINIVTNTIYEWIVNISGKTLSVDWVDQLSLCEINLVERYLHINSYIIYYLMLENENKLGTNVFNCAINNVRYRFKRWYLDVIKFLKIYCVQKPEKRKLNCVDKK